MDAANAHALGGEGSPLFVTPQLFDRIVGSDRTLIAIDTPRAEEVLNQFKQFARRSGNSIYSWTEDEGITSLREGTVSVSGSTRLPDALRYINASMQFGVYLFPGLSGLLRFSPLRAQCMALLRQISRARDGGANVRRVVLIDERVDLSDSVDAMMLRFADAPTAVRPLRLRDGRWIT